MTATALPPPTTDVPKGGRLSRQRLDWFELLVLAAFMAVSAWVLAVNLFYASRHGLVWIGADGEYPGDQLQYLAWIRDASHQVLVSDLFVPWATPHDYLQPAVAISGGLVALGMGPALALLLWKPVAVAALFFTARAYCRRTLVGRWERRAALVLALFGSAWFGILGDEWLPFISWGYPFALLAVATLVGSLLCYERGRGDRRISWLAPALGLLTSWLNPWEGEILLLVIVGTELVGVRRKGFRRRLELAALTVAATALPLVYYVALDRFDREWRVGRTVVAGHWPLDVVLLPLIPLLVAAALAYIRRPRGFLSTATLVWPFAALVAWALNEAGLGAWSLHSFTGITIPLGVLAVQGLQGVGFGRLPGHRWIGAAAVAALTIPVTVTMIGRVHAFVQPSTHQHNLITSSENRALEYLASDPRSGAVLSDFWIGVDVPGETGRRAYASGIHYWAEPNAVQRANDAQRLLEGPSWWWPPPRWYTGAAQHLPRGPLTGAAARAFVLGSGVRFVLQDCGSKADLRQSLGPIIRAVHQFGCATVYDVT